MSAETPGVTPRTPGLDPERAGAAAKALRESRTWSGAYAKNAHDVIAADDAHARSRGLVCQGDGLTREALAGLVRSWHEMCDVARHSPLCPTNAPCDCGVAVARGNAQHVLAALPSSLLDNPEADR